MSIHTKNCLFFFKITATNNKAKTNFQNDCGESSCIANLHNFDVRVFLQLSFLVLAPLRKKSDNKLYTLTNLNTEPILINISMIMSIHSSH